MTGGSSIVYISEKLARQQVQNPTVGLFTKASPVWLAGFISTCFYLSKLLIRKFMHLLRFYFVAAPTAVSDLDWGFEHPFPALAENHALDLAATVHRSWPWVLEISVETRD